MTVVEKAATAEMAIAITVAVAAGGATTTDARAGG
jgi:hypothetical protein